MVHDHHEDETYFLDQICMVALSGAFGVICLCLYFLQQGMLYRLLGTQFHPFVLASGIALVVLAVVRAGMLWSMAGPKIEDHSHGHDGCCQDESHSHEHSHSHGAGAHDHGHSHSHDHGHSQANRGHDHSHAVLAESRAFGHTPASAPAATPSHAHSQSQGHADHDHGWAPWRYVVLLVPIILFMLGLPNKGPSFNASSVAAVDTTGDAIEEAKFYFTLTALGSDRLAPLGPILVRLVADAEASDVDRTLDVKKLENLAARATDREYYKGKTVQVRGQYAQRNERYFELARFKIQCCAGDAIPISVPVLAKDSITGYKEQQWVEVTGRLDFRPDAKGSFKTVLRVTQRNQVRQCNPDLNPYFQ